jgi:hypothetical protein
MSSTPVVPAPKVSWLKKLGQDVLKVIGVVQKDEPAVQSVVEALVPASAPVFAIFDEIVQIVVLGESTFAAVGLAANGPAKLAAALPGVEALLDQWVSDNLPGSSAILSAESYVAARTANATAYINAVVAFLNSLPASSQTAVTSGAVAAASAAKAAVAAKG